MPSASQGKGHDLVVIGTSTGGLPALSQLVEALPAGLPAAVLIVMHLEAGFNSRLPELLTRKGKLRATHALHGEAIVPGRIYVAPPDNHIVVRSGYLNVLRGPKENNHRPSVDVLFRSAANAYGPRVIGVVLTGSLDCGTGGLLSIKARGGLAVVQDPDDAEMPEMPRSAIEHVTVDHVVPLRDMALRIERLVREPPGQAPSQIPRALREIEGEEPGADSEIVCPLCQGKLTEGELNGYRSFRCHVGHAFSLESMAVEQAEEVERALWAAARALEESAVLAARLANHSRGAMRERFLEKQDAQSQQAHLIRRILLSGGVLSAADAPGLAAPSPEGREENH
jgi:two-component system chemotaxis response regulator CheB